MRALLAFVAALAVAVPASPAIAEHRDGSSFVGRPDRASNFRFDRDRRHHRGRGTDSVYVYDRGYQGDSAWRSDSFNDWWHDNPDRAYPRWVQNNQGCPPERMWWSGTTLRC
jgi:hypothetical protein